MNPVGDTTCFQRLNMASSTAPCRCTENVRKRRFRMRGYLAGAVRAGRCPTGRISRPFSAKISGRSAAFGCVADVRIDNARSTPQSRPFSEQALKSTNDPKRTKPSIRSASFDCRARVRLPRGKVPNTSDAVLQIRDWRTSRPAGAVATIDSPAEGR